jgi:hypothetical protein
MISVSMISMTSVKDDLAGAVAAGADSMFPNVD